jgi:hypothetical protein
MINCEKSLTSADDGKTLGFKTFPFPISPTHKLRTATPVTHTTVGRSPFIANHGLINGKIPGGLLNDLKRIFDMIYQRT